MGVASFHLFMFISYWCIRAVSGSVGKLDGITGATRHDDTCTGAAHLLAQEFEKFLTFVGGTNLDSISYDI